MENRPPDEIDYNGTKFWYDEDGYPHNDNGEPAKIWVDGSKFWYKHGQLHNDFGPAQLWSSGKKNWNINGEYLSEEEFLQHKIKIFIYNG